MHGHLNQLSPGPPGPGGPGNRRRGPELPRPNRPGSDRSRHLALLGVAGESVGVVAGAAFWKVSGEPAWLVMSGISLALALVLLRRV